MLNCSARLADSFLPFPRRPIRAAVLSSNLPTVYFSPVLSLPRPRATVLDRPISLGFFQMQSSQSQYGAQVADFAFGFGSRSGVQYSIRSFHNCDWMEGVYPSFVGVEVTTEALVSIPKPPARLALTGVSWLLAVRYNTEPDVAMVRPPSVLEEPTAAELGLVWRLWELVETQLGLCLLTVSGVVGDNRTKLGNRSRRAAVSPVPVLKLPVEEASVPLLLVSSTTFGWLFTV